MTPEDEEVKKLAESIGFEEAMRRFFIEEAVRPVPPPQRVIYPSPEWAEVLRKLGLAE